MKINSKCDDEVSPFRFAYLQRTSQMLWVTDMRERPFCGRYGAAFPFGAGGVKTPRRVCARNSSASRWSRYRSHECWLVAGNRVVPRCIFVRRPDPSCDRGGVFSFARPHPKKIRKTKNELEIKSELKIQPFRNSKKKKKIEINKNKKIIFKTFFTFSNL